MSILLHDDVALYYDVHGPGKASGELRPLMLVAGLASDSQSWLTVLDALSANRRVVVFDNRGCGRTQPADARITIGSMAEDCLALADHLGIECFDLLGHSMGGFIALECVRRDPQRVARLVLANSSACQSARNQLLFADWADALTTKRPPRRWFRTFFYWIFTPGLFDNADIVDELLDQVLSYPFAQTDQGFRAQVEAMRGYDGRGALGDIDVPTLIVASSDDLLYPPGSDAAGLIAIPTVELVLIPDQAHAVHVESPALLTAPVLEFLDRPGISADSA